MSKGEGSKYECKAAGGTSTGRPLPAYQRFDNLVERHRWLIRRLCWRHSSGSVELCDELVHECYVSIWSHLASLREGSHTLQQTAWVIWQCRSVFSHRYRTGNSILVGNASERFNEWPADIVQPDETDPDTSDTRGLLEELATGLKPRERHLLSLIMDGYSLNEIAEMMAMKTEAVKKMKQRMITKMANNSKKMNL